MLTPHVPEPEELERHLEVLRAEARAASLRPPIRLRVAATLRLLAARLDPAGAAPPRSTRAPSRIDVRYGDA